MLSANGSIMSRISSRTETSGLMSPSSGRAAGALDGEGGAGFEHLDHAKTPRKISAARATRRPPRFIPSLPDYFGWIVAEPTPSPHLAVGRVCAERRDWLSAT